jgi:glyoxylase I family protein
MEKALGIGGVFFRSKDPKSLSDWYRTHLGIGEPPYGIWSQEPGPTIFAPFAEKTGYFGRDSQQFMLNFRVADLTAMIAQLQAAGITVETRAEWDSPETGRFARIHDPEGNPLELWQPA